MLDQEKLEKDVREYDIKVTRVKNLSTDGKTIIAFDMEVNGINIYGCTYKEGIKKDEETGEDKEWNLVDFPSNKGKDDKYYHRVWFPISNEKCKEIAKQIEYLL